MSFSKLFNLVSIAGVVTFVVGVAKCFTYNDVILNYIFIGLAMIMLGFFFKEAVKENKKTWVLSVPISIILVLISITFIFT